MVKGARPRVVLYLRLSEQNVSYRTADGHSASIGRQRTDLTALAAQEGWEVAQVYADDGSSGLKSRTNADRAVADLAAGRADVLAVWKWDRFSREGISAVAKVADALAANPTGLFVAHIDGLRSDTPAWESVASRLAVQANEEATNTGTRVSRARQANRRAGRFTGGTVPIGYRIANAGERNGTLHVNTEEARAFLNAALAIIEGASIYSATQDLNRLGIRPRRAQSWSVQAVTQALTSPPIVGQVSIEGELLCNADGSPRQVFPPAIPIPIWNEVRAVIASRRDERRDPSPTQRVKRVRLLSGLVLCGSCRARLYVRTNSSGNTSYRCGSVSNGRPCSNAASVTSETVEAFVTERVLARVGTVALQLLVTPDGSAAAIADTLEAIEKTAREFGARGANYEALTFRMQSLQKRRAELETIAASTPRTARYVSTGKTFGEIWANAGALTRREQLARVVSAIEVHPASRNGGRWQPLDDKRISITWRTGAAQAPVRASDEPETKHAAR